MEAMVKLLDADVPISLEDMARDVFELAWMIHDARPKMGIIIDQPGVGVTLHGPFETPAQAQKYLTRFPFAGPGRPRVLITRMQRGDGDSTEEES